MSTGLLWQLKLVLAYGLTDLDPHISPNIVHSINYQLQIIMPKIETGYHRINIYLLSW
jgi:hypothetical protein